MNTVDEYCYGDGQPEGATVREVLTAAYGEDWERSLSDIVSTGERSEMQYVTDASGFKNFRHDYFPLIALSTYSREFSALYEEGSVGYARG